MNSKRGGAIAEAAIVFPVVIITVLTVIYILTALYTDASYAARDHLALRFMAGDMTETVVREDEYGSAKPFDKFGRKPFLEKADITQGSRYLDKVLNAERGRVYVVDEADYIRKADLLKGIIDGF